MSIDKLAQLFAKTVVELSKKAAGCVAVMLHVPTAPGSL
jgi:hypothetical protein